MELDKNYIKDLFIDEVKGCLISDVGGYDTNGDGVIDNATQLGGIDADQYALKTDIPNKAADSDKLGGVAANQYALKTDIRSPIVTDDGNGNVSIL